MVLTYPSIKLSAYFWAGLRHGSQENPFRNSFPAFVWHFNCIFSCLPSFECIVLEGPDALQRIQRCLQLLVTWSASSFQLDWSPNPLAVVHVAWARSREDSDLVDSLAWEWASRSECVEPAHPFCEQLRWQHVSPESSPPFCWAPWSNWTPCRQACGDRSRGMSIEWAWSHDARVSWA